MEWWRARRLPAIQPGTGIQTSYFHSKVISTQAPSARFLKHPLPKAAPNMCPLNARLVQTPLQTQQERFGTWRAEKRSKKWPLLSSRAWNHPGRELEGMKLWLGKLTGMAETHSFIGTPLPTRGGKQGPCGIDWAWAMPRRLQFKTNLIIKRKAADPEEGRNGGERENSCICTFM